MTHVWVFPFKWSILTAILLVGIYFLLYRTNQRVKKSWKGTQIEIEPHEIRIVDGKGAIKDVFRLAELDNLEIPESFGIPADTFKNLSEEISGKPLKNFIQFGYRGKKFECHFIPESYYMLKQLEKIRNEWEKGNEEWRMSALVDGSIQ